MRTRLLAGLAAVLAGGALAAQASAHAEISPPVAQKGTAQLFSLVVPTEEEGATTTGVELAVPQGFGIDSFEAAPGWRRSTPSKGSVRWTGGHTPTDEDSVFRFLATPTKAGGLVFTVRQTYSDGKVVEWSGPESSDTPAPRIEAVSSLAGGGGGGGSSTAEIIAIVVAALALVVSLVALLRGGRELA